MTESYHRRVTGAILAPSSTKDARSRKAKTLGSPARDYQAVGRRRRARKVHIAGCETARRRDGGGFQAVLVDRLDAILLFGSVRDERTIIADHDLNGAGCARRAKRRPMKRPL